MDIRTNNKHKNYEILNLIGYGLSKFDIEFVKAFGFDTKTSFYSYIVSLGIADTIGTVKNRQDLFDPFFDNGRKGWWQKGDVYIHRKHLIDNLFGKEDLLSYANIVRLFIKEKYKLTDFPVKKISPVFKTRFKKLQETGLEAEEFFINNFQKIDVLKDGVIEDARMFGDGYDFQISINNNFILAEIKGIRSNYGGIRLTEKEFKTAKEYKNEYALVIISNLINEPKINFYLNPLYSFKFHQKISHSKQTSYHIGAKQW